MTNLYDQINYLKIEQQELAYIDMGYGSRTCFFIHGMGSNFQAWSRNIKELAKEYRCVAIDLPGYGFTASNGDFISIPDYADIVLEVIDVLGLNNVILVGHSMGGHICLELARRNETHIHKAVLIAPAGLEKFTSEEIALIKSVMTADFIENYTRAIVVENFEKNFFQMPDDARFMINDRMELMDDGPAYRQFCRVYIQSIIAMLDYPIFEKLSDISIPALIIFGQDDALIPHPMLHPEQHTVAIAEQGANELQNGRLEILPEAGHFVHWEKSGEVNDLIFDFIDL